MKNHLFLQQEQMDHQLEPNLMVDLLHHKEQVLYHQLYRQHRGVISGGASCPIFTIVAVPSRSSTLKSVSTSSLFSSSKITKSSISRDISSASSEISKSPLNSNSSSVRSSPSASLTSIKELLLDQ